MITRLTKVKGQAGSPQPTAGSGPVWRERLDDPARGKECAAESRSPPVCSGCAIPDGWGFRPLTCRRCRLAAELADWEVIRPQPTSRSYLGLRYRITPPRVRARPALSFSAR
ncbi:hypothetical protein SKAU_G00028520 [Synaphobranchus kaupii]|uniref:Uncharacterized protein n=1 Tax=Synaphobranchus kaupii TaxID=118154 RepID=A0A9Q1GEK7_SYNKA|nr:hypothetical protein SKAU_G00028520 [Synaphobranchus kaupii]